MFAENITSLQLLPFIISIDLLDWKSEILILRQGIIERVYERQRGKEKERFLIRKKIDAKFVELLSISHKCPQLSSSQFKNLENGLNAISNTSLYQ